MTLIEGPSGAGKSSVFAALRGAVAFDGDARLNDTPVDTLSPATWLAWAGQHPGLIGGTIAENVALGDDETDAASRRDLVRRALAVAQADALDPDQELGVQGAGVSGGQAQRLAVARAVFRHLRGRAPVIALDEPSSALDAATEAALWHGIRGLADDGATVLLISHRRSAREIADRVVTLSATRAEVGA